MLILSDKVVCIGCTERTQPGAIEFVAANLFKKGFEAVYAFEMERGRNAMHLDGMLTMVDRDAFLFNPFLSGNVNVYKLTPLPMASGRSPSAPTGARCSPMRLVSPRYGLFP